VEQPHEERDRKNHERHARSSFDTLRASVGDRSPITCGSFDRLRMSVAVCGRRSSP
jgi:hypothetical protein